MSDGRGPHSQSKSVQAVPPTPTLNRGPRKILYLIIGRIPRITAACVFGLTMVLLVFRLAGGQFIHMGEGFAEPGPMVGSLLFVRPLDAADVRIGDVLAISKGAGDGPYVVRRVLEVDQSGRTLAAPTRRDGSLHDADVLTQADTRAAYSSRCPALAHG